MGKTLTRTPKGYDGTRITTHKVSDLLSAVLAQVSEVCQGRPDLILAAWPEIIGPQFAPMTQAVSLQRGILTVKVKNSTLHSLLSRYDKRLLLTAIRRKFPNADIQNIVFRIS